MKEVTRDPKKESGRRMILVILAGRQEREREMEDRHQKRAFFDSKILPLLKP